jgi:hypothetical protein
MHKGGVDNNTVSIDTVCRFILPDGSLTLIGRTIIKELLAATAVTLLNDRMMLRKVSSD